MIFFKSHSGIIVSLLSQNTVLLRSNAPSKKRPLEKTPHPLKIEKFNKPPPPPRAFNRTNTGALNVALEHLENQIFFVAQHILSVEQIKLSFENIQRARPAELNVVDKRPVLLIKHQPRRSNLPFIELLLNNTVSLILFYLC